MYRQRAAPRGRRWQKPRRAAVANQQGQGIGNFFRAAKNIAKSEIACNIGKKHLNICQTFMKICQEKYKIKNLEKYLIRIAQKNWLDVDQVMDKIN